MIYDISLIIPAYNVEAYIEATLFSVSSQVTQAKVQCIVIDDASTDGTKSVVLQCERKFPGNMVLELISLEYNKGVAFVRNLGVAHSKADHIVFLDADDLMVPEALEYLWKTAKSTDADIVDTEFIQFRDENKLNFFLNQKNHAVEIINQQHRLAIIKGFPWGKIYRKSLFEGVCFPQGLIVEDIITLPQLILRAQCVIKSNWITVAYRKRLGSLSGRESAVKNKYAQHMLRGIEYLLSCESSRESSFSEAFNESLWNEMTIVFRSRSFYCSRSEMKQHLYELSALLDRWISCSPRVRYLLRANLLNLCIDWAIRNQYVVSFRILARIKKRLYQSNQQDLIRLYEFN